MIEVFVPAKKWALYPVLIFGTVWLLAAWLYGLHLSGLFIFDAPDAFGLAMRLLLPFALGALFLECLLFLMHRCRLPHRADTTFTFDDARLWTRIKWYCAAWLVITIGEILVSGGLPIVWLMQGSEKTYYDFGIHSIHGFLNSLISALALISYFAYLVTRKYRFLLFPGLLVFWSVVQINRNVLTASVLQFGFVYLLFRQISWKSVVRYAVIFLVFIYIFGLVGDIRSGADQFISLAQPTPNFPRWLPSGFLWVYIYMGSPINNLLFTFQNATPAYDPTFFNTTSLLLPSVLRAMVYPEHLLAVQGELVEQAFNVSTAFVGVYQDMGFLGIFFYCFTLGFICSLVWRRSHLRSFLVYAVLAQCLILSVFFNHFLYLPVIFQVFWIAVIMDRRILGTPSLAAGQAVSNP
jgi:oligosaccharide repeat unit polymerase